MKRSQITVVLGFALLALGASRAAGAQSMPGAGAKGAAQRAANKTDTRLAAQTGQAVKTRNTAPTATTPAAQPSAKAPAKSAAADTARTQPKPAAQVKATGKDSTRAPAKPAAPEVAFSREIFSYDASGRRDPFMSLLASGDLRPAYTDLKLVAVAYDPTGRKSVAVMRDVSSNDQYRVKVGQTLGRMRVAQIHPKSVTFTIDEFGYSRQEILALGDSTNTRNP
jgi:hypothetical protein